MKCDVYYEYSSENDIYGNALTIGYDTPFIAFGPKPQSGEYDYNKRVLGDTLMKIYDNSCNEILISSLVEGDIVDTYYVRDEAPYNAPVVIALQKK
jgi:hypothetical protein